MATKRTPPKTVRELSVQATRSFAGFVKGDTFIVAEDEESWARTQAYVKSGYLKVLGDTETVELPEGEVGGQVLPEHPGDSNDAGPVGGSGRPAGVPKD